MRQAKQSASARTIHKERVELDPQSGQSLPKSAKKRGIIVSFPQRERIKQRYVAGQSIREIAREEGRARETVTKIVRSPDMERMVRQMRERYYGLADDALESLRRALERETNGRLAHQVLKDVGVVPSPEERMLLTDERVREIVRRLIREMMDSERTVLKFGQQHRMGASV